MFTVYAEKEALERIVVLNDETPNWYDIFCNHAEVCLNMTEEELAAELIEGTAISEFIKITGGRSPLPRKMFFDEVYANPAIIAEKPRAVFFLNYSSNNAASLQKAYGVVVQGREWIDDSILKGSFFRDLTKDAVFGSSDGKGWNHLIQFSLPPSNALIISDEHLFSNEENSENIGKANLISLVDAFLPAKLETSYHITIIASDAPGHPKPARSTVWCETMAQDLKTSIIPLRPYSIVFEIVFTSTLHKRRLMMNYVNAWCDKGFAVFRVGDGKTVRSDNDFTCNRIFNRTKADEGDTDFQSMEKALIKLKNKCHSVHQYIKNTGLPTTGFRILGDCNEDFVIRNRLINDA